MTRYRITESRVKDDEWLIERKTNWFGWLPLTVCVGIDKASEFIRMQKANNKNAELWKKAFENEQ